MHQSLRESPLGRCLYCERTDSLSEEHVIPFGIGGRFIIPAASCPACSTVTSEFERRVLRGFMAAARAVAGFPTRRPKERPAAIPVTVTHFTGSATHLVPVEAATALLPLPLFEVPGVLASRNPGGDILLIGHETIRFGIDPAVMAGALEAEEIVLQGSWDIVSFARMLVKIGVGFASAACGPLPLEDVPLLGFLQTGDTREVSHWLGSAHVAVSPGLEGATHTAVLRVSDHPTDASTRLVSVQIKLFANSGAQGYEVVVASADRSSAVFHALVC